MYKFKVGDRVKHKKVAKACNGLVLGVIDREESVYLRIKWVGMKGEFQDPASDIEPLEQNKDLIYITILGICFAFMPAEVSAESVVKSVLKHFK